MDKDSLKKIVSHSKEYGFIFPSSEIYEGLNAIYDYAHNGTLLKNNIREYWWKSMVQLNDNIVGIDSAIFMHPKTWVASGHVDAFNDPLIDNKDSKKRYRADVLIEEHIEKLNLKIQKEINKAEKRFKEKFDKKDYEKSSFYYLDLDKSSRNLLFLKSSILSKKLETPISFNISNGPFVQLKPSLLLFFKKKNYKLDNNKNENPKN